VSRAVLTGLERLAVHNAIRAGLGVKFEIPFLLGGVSLSASAIVLDIGTGLGWGTLGLIRLVHPRFVVAADYDISVLPQASQYLAARGVKRWVAFVKADAKSLPFPDAVFDLVLAAYVLHHVMGYSPAISEIGRVTKPGGIFAFIDPVRLSFMPRRRQLDRPLEIADWSELVSDLEAAHFQVERRRGLPFLLYVIARRSE